MHKGTLTFVTLILTVSMVFAASDVYNRSNSAYEELNGEFTSEESYSKSASKPASKQPASASYNDNQDPALDKVKPTILVVPAKSGKGADAMQVALNNPYTKACLAEINSYLVGKGYDLKSLEGQDALNNLSQVQQGIAGYDDDMAYIASLSVGADAYVTCDGEAYAANKTLTMNLAAYETTTARLLSQATISKELASMNQGVLAAGFKELSKKLMPEVERKMLMQWRQDLKSGVRYKIVFKVVGDFSEDDVEDLHDSLKDSMKSLFSQVKFDKMTSATIEATVFADPSKYDDAQDVAGKIRKNMKTFAKISKKNVTAKFILLEIK